MRPCPRLAAVIALPTALFGGACGVTRLQTAKTTPPGTTVMTIGTSVVRSNEDHHGPVVPLDLMVRRGATENVDWGIRQFFGIGVVADAKWNLLPADGRLALAVSGGVGAAYDGAGTTEPFVAHIPLTISASAALFSWLTAYAGAGYGAYWIFGYAKGDPKETYAARTWTGDGLLSLHAGLDLSWRHLAGVMLEYTYARPIVDDPGDFYRFSHNHFFSLAIHLPLTRMRR